MEEETRKRKLSSPEEIDAARIKRKKVDEFDQILSTIRSKECVVRDLHTHLLGMGSATFWLDNLIMDIKIMPSNLDFEDDELLRRFLGPLVWDYATNSFFSPKNIQIALDSIIHNTYKHESADAAGKVMRGKVDECLAKLEYTVQEFEDFFSYDVVYELEHLRISFDLPEVNNDIVQSQLESILGLTTNYSTNIECHPFHPYIIWNARLQQFDFIQSGISNSDLRRVLEDKSSQQAQALRSFMVNAFSMCSREGEKATLVDLHAYRGNWAQFYPRRYKLKDSIYQQRLDVLAYLLQHCLQNYATCNPPVSYVEFSIGVGDLSRPWVLEVLSSYEPVPLNELKEKNSFTRIQQESKEYEELKHVLSFLDYHNQVEYHFLAGFNRSSVKKIVDSKSPLDILIANGDAAIDVFNQEYKTNQSLLFKSAIEALEYLATIHQKAEYMKDDYFSDQDNNPKFTYWIVGFDLFGEELGYPYCPFVTQPFLNFIKAAMVHNPLFGVRIHCAETIPLIRPNLPGFALFCNHLYISFCIIKFLVTINIRVRIGHGVVFATVMATNYDTVTKRKSVIKLAYIKQHATEVFRKTVFELNLTSNFYLLHDPPVKVTETSVLGFLLKEEINIPAILSTDDDGIWPLDTCHGNHFKHHSLAHEICRAISENILSAEKFKIMLANMKKFSFYQSGLPSITRQEQSAPVAIIPPFIVAAPVAQALLATPQANNNTELFKVIQDSAPNKNGQILPDIDLKIMSDLAQYLAFFLGYTDKDLDDDIKQILRIMKNDFLKGSATQCQTLHLIVSDNHHMIFLSQPKGIKELIEGLKKLEGLFIEGKDPIQATYYIFIKDFEDSIVEAIKQLWLHAHTQSKLEAHIFTKTKNRRALKSNLQCSQGIIKVDEKNEHLKRTNPVSDSFHKNQPFICFFGYNSSAVGSILKVILASKPVRLPMEESWIDSSFKPFYTKDRKIIYVSSSKQIVTKNEDYRMKNYPFLPATVLTDDYATIHISQSLNEELSELWKLIPTLRQVPTKDLYSIINMSIETFVAVCADFSIMPLEWCVIDNDFYTKNEIPFARNTIFPVLEGLDATFICTKAKYSSEQDPIAEQMMFVFKKCTNMFLVLQQALSILLDKRQQDSQIPHKRYEMLWAHFLLQTITEAGFTNWTPSSVDVLWEVIEQNLGDTEMFDIFCHYTTLQSLSHCVRVLTDCQPACPGHAALVGPYPIKEIITKMVKRTNP